MEENETPKEVSVTKEQLAIIQAPITSSNVLFIKSGPGTGKTHTLVLKIAYLINELKVPPQDILVLSMTNKAVDNLKDKLKGFLTLEQIRAIRLNTFHAYCHDLVSLAYGDGFDILQSEGLNILVQLFHHKKIKTKRDVEKFITLYSSGGYGGDDALEEIGKEFELKVEEIQDMARIFDNMNVVTFAELLKRGGDLIKEYVEAGDIDYKVVIVDEFQDMYHDIFQIVRSITSDQTHLVVAGDLNQSIYEFLNDKPVDISSLPKSFDELEMSRSFRSTNEILDASKFILEKEVNLYSKKFGVKPVFNVFDTDHQQYDFIIQEIKRLKELGINLSDIAILSRTNMELTRIGELLSKNGIDYIKLSSLPSWLQNENFIYFIHYLRILLNPKECNFQILCTLKLLPRMGSKRLRQIYDESIGMETNLYEYLTNCKNKHLINYIQTIDSVRNKIDFSDPQDILSKLLFLSSKLGLANKIHTDDQYERRKLQDQLVDFYKSLIFFYESPDLSPSILTRSPPTPIESFLKNFMNIPSRNRYRNKLKLSTLHQSKGLEFPTVFITNADIDNQDPQERNLLYVGMTRPKKLLYMNVLDPAGDFNRGLFNNNERKYHTVFGAGKPDRDLLKRVFRGGGLAKAMMRKL